MEQNTKPLPQLLQELSPEHQTKVRAYIDYLLTPPPRVDGPPPPGEPGREAVVSLREVTGETVRSICRLSDSLTPPEKFMVAPNAVSIAQAHFEPHAWFRAVYADDTPVGFCMLYDEPEERSYFLWRFMIAEPHHGKGYGQRALELVTEYVRTRPGATELRTSCGQGAGSPEGFYQRIGFRRNGEMYGDEVGLVLPLEDGENP